jgi:hypothetical protein
MPPPEGKITQAEFVKRLKAKIPELASFPEHEVWKYALDEDPSILAKVYTPDDAAADEQARLKESSKYPGVISPEQWAQHPNLKKFTSSVVDTIPGLAGLAGGVLGTGATPGLGTAIGFGTAYGAGRGARDLIAQSMGLEPGTTPVDKALNIGGETLFAATVPGAIESVLHPIETSRLAAARLANVGKALTPSRWRAGGFDFGDPLRAWAEGGKKIDPFVRPSWQVQPPFPPEPVDPSPLRPTGTGSPTSLPPEPPLPWRANQPTPPKGLSPTGTSTPPAPASSEPLTFGVGGPKVRVPGASGTGVPSAPVSNEPTPWSMKVKESPIGPTTTPSAPSSGGTIIHGNEERMYRDAWDIPTVHKLMEEGWETGGKDASGKVFMKRPITTPKKTSSIKPIIQHSPSTGKVRGSTDGGMTWRYSNDEGNTWNEEDV